MKIIIFTGAPASGKSTLSEEIGRILNIQVISKDSFKIKLFEKYGFVTHEDKKKLSRKGEELMYQHLKESVCQKTDIIIDNNFKNFNKFREILNEFPEKLEVTCIYCKADYDILASRYNDRISSGNRHQALYTMKQYPVIEGVSEFHKKITSMDVERIDKEVTERVFGERVLYLDTNNIENDFKKLVERVLNYINTK